MRVFNYLYEKCCGDPDPRREPLVEADEETATDPTHVQAEEVTPSRVCLPCMPTPKFLYSTLIPGVVFELAFIGAYSALVERYYSPPSDGSSSFSSDSASSSAGNHPDGTYIIDPIAVGLVGIFVVGGLGSFFAGARAGAYVYDRSDAVKNTFTALRDKLCPNSSDQSPAHQHAPMN